MSDAESMRQVLRRHELTPKKSLGQHFLLDLAVCRRVVASAGCLERRQVVEIGCGPGGLTRALLESDLERLVAIDIDPRAVRAVKSLALRDRRLETLAGDATTLRIDTLVQAPRAVVANLPYNVGTPILIGLLRNAASWEHLTVMLQQEVAERLSAAPGSPAYGRLSVLAQWLCRVSLTMRLPPTVFTPPPKVWSSVVRLTPHDDLPPSWLLSTMELLTATAFGQRRKMLRASLRSLGGADMLAMVGIDPSRRAETLLVSEFERLARFLARPKQVVA